MDFSETAQLQIIVAAECRPSLLVGADVAKVVSQAESLGVSQGCFVDIFPP